MRIDIHGREIPEPVMCEAQWDLDNLAPHNPLGYRYTPRAHEAPVEAEFIAVLALARLPICRAHAHYLVEHLAGSRWALESIDKGR